MYPLKVVLIGDCEKVLPHVRRELLNREARLQSEFLNVRSALIGLETSREEMRLFIVHVRSSQELSQLKRLSGTFVGRPILALVDNGNDSAVLVAAMRAGAAQVVPLPMLVDDFRAALDCIGIQFGHSTAHTPVVAISGVNGGCGATSLALNLAYEISYIHQRHAILIELSPQMGMLATYLNVEPRFTIHDLLKNAADLDSYMVQLALTKVSENLQVLVGPHEAIAPAPVTVAEVSRILDYARQLADVVVVDVPATFNDLYFETLKAADHVVLVGEQKLPSIRNMKLVLEALGGGTATDSPHLIINRYDSRLQGFGTVDLERVLRVPRVQTVARDATVDEALARGCPLRLHSSASPVLADLDQLAGQLLNIQAMLPPPVGSSSSILGRLSHAFGLV